MIITSNKCTYFLKNHIIMTATLKVNKIDKLIIPLWLNKKNVMYVINATSQSTEIIVSTFTN